MKRKIIEAKILYINKAARTMISKSKEARKKAISSSSPASLASDQLFSTQSLLQFNALRVAVRPRPLVGRPSEMKWRDASAVILAARTAFGGLQQASGGYRVLTGQRASKSSFLPDGFVFPGGVFEPEQDAADHWTQLFKRLNFTQLSLDSVTETHPGKKMKKKIEK